MEGIDKLLAGPTAIAYSFEDPAAPAKIAAKIAKGEEKFVIKGGYVDGKALDVKGVEALSNAARQGRAARDFPCNFARRASELPPPCSTPRRRISSICWPRARNSSSEGEAPSSSDSGRRYCTFRFNIKERTERSY